MTATLPTDEAAFRIFKALYTADNAAGGLNAAGNAHVQAFIRMWNIQADGGTAPEPRIEFEVVDDVDQPSPTVDSVNMRVRMHLWTPHDPDSTREQTILTRMRVVYRGASGGSAQGNWTGVKIKWWRSPRAPSAKPSLNHRIVECTIKMTAA